MCTAFIKINKQEKILKAYQEDLQFNALHIDDENNVSSSN